MRGDFSRLTFDPAKQFTRVLMQQGRVQLDSDWNEQASLLLHQVRLLARSIIGPFGGVGKAFAVTGLDLQHGVVEVTAGDYFVNGIACHTDGAVGFSPPADWHDGAPID